MSFTIKGKIYSIAKEYLYFGMVVMFLGMAGVLLPQIYAGKSDTAKAVGSTYTVCASDCDYTAIQSAIDASSEGDTVTVGATYELENDDTISVSANRTLDCQNSGAVVGSSTSFSWMYSYATSTVQNCTLENVKVAVLGVNTEITSNTFNFNLDDPGCGDFIGLNNYDNVSFTSNAINASLDVFGCGSGGLVSMGSSDNIDFSYNNIIFSSVSSSANLGYPILVGRGDNLSITNNYITQPEPGLAANVLKSIYVSSGNILNLDISHNTFYIREVSDGEAGISIIDTGESAVISVTSSYNLYYTDESYSGLLYGNHVTKSYNDSAVTINHGYNGYVGANTNLVTTGTYSGEITTGVIGSDSFEDDAFFISTATSSVDYLHLKSHSPFLDVSGSQDIGAFSADRPATFVIDDDGVVDYVTVHASSTDIIPYLIASDTVSLLAGTYDPFTIGVDNLTVSGAGASTIIESGANNGITLSGVSSSTIQDLVVQNGSGAGLGFHMMSDHSFSYDGNNYTDTSYVSPNASTISELYLPGNISSYVNETPQNWHLLFVHLVDGGTTYHVLYIDASDSSIASVSSTLVGSSYVVDLSVENAFRYENGGYVYYADPSVSVLSGTPAIDLAQSYDDYNMTGSLYHYGVNDYDDSQVIGAPPNESIVLSSGSSCSVTPVSTFEFSSILGSGINLNLYLVNFGDGAAYLTIWAPDNYADSDGAFNALCGGDGAAEVKFVADVFTVDESGDYAYHADTLAGEDISLVSGFDAPSITYSVTNYERSYYSGIKIASSTGSIISNVTTTGNDYGVWFSGDSASNNVSSTIFSSNLDYDIYSDSTGDNNLKNSTFNSASSSIASTGDVNAYFKARAFVTSAEGALAGVTVSAISTDESQTASLASGVDGYTSYTDYLLAWTMTSSSATSVTNGGYNPYTFGATATSTYSASTTSANLTTPNQLFTLAMVDDTSPDVPTIATTTPTSTSITIEWAAVDEASTYTVSSTAGTATTTSETSVSYVGLAPNTQYSFQILATDASSNDSSYSTASSTYTNPVVPGTPSASIC